MNKDNELLKRITIDLNIFGGKPIIRGHRLAVEHVLELLNAGDTEQTLLNAYPWLEKDDIETCSFWKKKNTAVA